MKLLTAEEVAALTDRQATERIATLRTVYRAELAAPLMSEGGISPTQINRMSDRARAQWQKNAQVRMAVEVEIRELRKPHEQRRKEGEALQRRLSLAEARSTLNQLTRSIPDMCLYGLGARGKVRPSYQREVDKQQEELRRILREHPELASEQTVRVLDTEQLVAAAMAEKARLKR